MNPLWLLVIVPFCFFVGLVIGIACVSGNVGTITGGGFTPYT